MPKLKPVIGSFLDEYAEYRHWQGDKRANGGLRGEEAIFDGARELVEEYRQG
jgi:hypothetical protein